MVNLGRPIVTNGAFATHSSHITLRTCCCFYKYSRPILISARKTGLQSGARQWRRVQRGWGQFPRPQASKNQS